MKKGFTLIELLGVIIIISLLALLTSIAVTKLVKDSKQQLSNVQKELIKSSAEMWGADNLDRLPNKGECVYLSVSDLKNEGLLDNSEKLDDNIIVRIKNKLNENGKEKLEYKVNGATAGCSNGVKDLYKDESKANIPSLRGLVPVVYDEEKSSWKIIDPTEEWYDYDNQWWANAVILREDLREEKNIGDLITVDGDNPEVLAMFVWIPRYSYTIKDEYGRKLSESNLEPTKETPGAIDIKFVGVDSIKENGLATYEGDTPSEWYTHPAFTFGDEELSGIWVGKFEITGTVTSPSILPNQGNGRNLRCQQTSTKYKISQLYNQYVMLDSHMMKSSEWGAAAYMSQSKYGKYGNKGTEVYVNNCTSKTGAAADTKDASYSTETCTNSYETQKGQEASTTGNITGIYDMSGGFQELVMGIVSNEDGKPFSGGSLRFNSGFNGPLTDNTIKSDGVDFPNSKYYDKYTKLSYCVNKECMGHALNEVNGWYSDKTVLNFNTTLSWLVRGGGYGSSGAGSSGIFSSRLHNGDAGSCEYSFRVVLSQTN